MKRSEFENYLGKPVRIKLFDGDFILGFLRKTQAKMFKEDPDLYLPKNYYFVTGSEESKVCISCIFKVSHVKKIELV